MYIEIKGAGAVSSYGAGMDALVSGLFERRPSASEYAAFPLPYSGEFKVNQFPQALFHGCDDVIDTVADMALKEAIDKAGLAKAARRDCALIVGTSGFLFEAECVYLREKAAGGVAPTPVSGRGTGRIASRIASGLGLIGPVLTVTTACTSSANALLMAQRLLRRKQAKRAIVMGIEALSAFTLNGFYSLMLLSPDGTRPFDASRVGIQLGSGCAAVILESTDSQPARHADLLLGGANLCDTHNVISTNLDGKVAMAVMAAAVKDSGMDSSDIVAIKAHGTGSVDNDSTEATAMKALFGADIPPFTGLKGYVGHTLGACGALETVALLGALKKGFIPMTLGFEKIDPAFGLSPITRPMNAISGNYMLNFFGFGGNNTSLIIRYGGR